MKKTTEQGSNYINLDKMPVTELLKAMNTEDRRVPYAIEGVIPAIEALVNAIIPKMQAGGRLFYLGAGTSGRLGVVDASECPTTFGIPTGRVIGVIAGGDVAISQAVEFIEDDVHQAWDDLCRHHINKQDFLVGISASGYTPYVVSGLQKANMEGIHTGCIVCNKNSPLAAQAIYPIEVIVGPELLTGSTRLKAGTAQKLILNMISTAVMIRLGKVRGSQMIDVKLHNQKLIQRGMRMLSEFAGIKPNEAEGLLKQYGSVRKALDAIRYQSSF